MFVTEAGDTGLPVGEIVDADEFVAANKKAKAENTAPAKFRPVHNYSSVEEAIAAYAAGDVGLHAPIGVRMILRSMLRNLRVKPQFHTHCP